GAFARGALLASLPRHDGGAARGGRGCRENVLLELVTVPGSPANEAPYRLLNGVEFGAGVVVHPFTNLYGCQIGDESRIGPFVEIQSGVEIGARCKIQSHSFICSGVTIADEVFIGHGVLFINDKRPHATTPDGELQTRENWTLLPTVVERG